MIVTKQDAERKLFTFIDDLKVCAPFTRCAVIRLSLIKNLADEAHEKLAGIFE